MRASPLTACRGDGLEDGIAQPVSLLECHVVPGIGRAVIVFQVNSRLDFPVVLVDEDSHNTQEVALSSCIRNPALVWLHRGERDLRDRIAAVYSIAH